jgi:alpha-L-fucosidase
VDHVILEEEGRFGQRVRGFRVEGLAGGEWVAAGAGSSIGHKRILPVQPREFSALRLVVTEAAGEARVRRFAAFDTEVAPPPSWDASAKLWADNAVGHWDQGRFEVDLSKKITEATEYRLRFVGEDGRVTGIGAVQLLLDGAPAAHLVKPERGRPDALVLTMTGIGQKTVLSGTVAGAERGTILLQKL